MAKFSKKKNNEPKNRKELRKAQRKQKKERKFHHYMNRNKPGKFVIARNVLKEKTKIPEVKTKVEDKQMKEIKLVNDMHKKLQKDMAKQRKKQLKAANIEEDRNIKHLEKQLKLNKRKNKSIPKSFAADGLDYLLEVCEPENMKSIVAAENQFADLNDEFEDDLALIAGSDKKKDEESMSDDNSISINESGNVSEKSENESDHLNTDSEKSENESDHLNSDIDSEKSKNESDSEDDFNTKSNKRKASFSLYNSQKKNKKTEKLKNSDSDELHNESRENSSQETDKSENELNEEVWEDIYGRKRNKEGAIVTDNTGKYIPPALRALKEGNLNVDKKHAEKIARLKKQLKGLLNRVAESNMHSISSQIEEMYMSNSRNDVNDTLTQLIFEALIASVITPERLLLEYMLLITILHANVGTEVGAHFLQQIVKKFNDLYHKNQEVENKELDNTVHVIAQLYNYKVFHSQLLYQILSKLTEKFEEKHVECILLVLKNVGFSLRKDDPLALKQLILDLQKKASSVTDNNARVKYMLDILLAIKNNNVTKIPNYDTTYSEHLKKVLKNFVRKGNYITQLNISLDDLLKAEERGRWWIVGSAWTGTDDRNPEKNAQCSVTSSYNQKLLDLARKQRMNTDTRRNIFCALMTAENYSDAFEKILSLNMKGQQEREIIHVLLHCSLQEKEYNPFYSYLAQKFCEYDRKFQMMIRCSIWDKLKALTDCTGKQISILAKLLTHLFLNQGLPISTLKVIQFSELDQVTLRLIRQVLLGIMLHSDEETSIAVFEKVSTTSALKMFRESLRLFIHHFLLRNLSNTELSEEKKELLTSRAKVIEKSLLSFETKIKF